MESPNTRVWIDELAARGVVPVAIAEKEPTWDIEWAPLAFRRPAIRGIGLGRLEIARTFARICKTHHLDLVHNHQLNLTSFWTRSSGVRPRVITCWGSDVLLLNERPLGYRLGARTALRSADAVTVGSRHLFNAAVAAGAIPSRCANVGWGVDTDTFARTADARLRVRAMWGAADRPVVLSTRQLKPLYRVDAIIRAFAVLRRDGVDAMLVIASDGPERPALEALVREEGLESQVLFLGHLGSTDSPSIAEVYAGADVYCSVPLSDGGPLSVLEAMAASLPVVATDLPVMCEWIAESKAGLLWGDTDPASLGSLLARALESARDLGANARRFVLAHHDRRVEMDRVFELYGSLVERPGS